jgi:hypothetical protein
VFVVLPPLCTGGNEAHGGLAESSIVKTAGSSPGEDILDTHLRVGKAPGYPWSYLTRIFTRTRGKLNASLYLGKNTDIVEREFASLPHL